MDRKKRNLAALGVLTILAAIIFYVGFYYLLGNPIFKGGMDVIVKLDNGAGLKRGDRVVLQGVEVGSVKGVGLEGPSRVIVTVRLNDRFDLPADTKARITGDVFGAHSIELVPGDAVVMLEKGDTIGGLRERALTEMAGDIGSRVSGVLSRADSLLSQQTVSDLRETAAILPGSAVELRAALTELRGAATALRRTTLEVESAKTGEALRAALLRVDESVRGLAVTAAALERAAAAVEVSAGSLASITRKIDQGQGSLGRMVNDSALYVEFSAAAREFRMLAADVRARPSRYINLKIF
jgi:phospholipid/cholesterol/gamma-HCH transport system substrate-binding protein